MMILSAVASCYGLLALLMLSAGAGSTTDAGPVVLSVTLGLIGWIILVVILEKTIFQKQRRAHPSASEPPDTAGRDFADAVFTYAASGIMVLDRTGQVLKINRLGCVILQQEEAEIVGKPITDIFPESKDMLEVNAELNREVVVTLRDGSQVPIGFSNSLFTPSASAEHGVIVSFKDLSELKKLRAEIRRKEDMNAMGKVISGVAHEIRNPLFGISSIGQILQREIKSPQHQALIQAMLRETDRMKHLIEEFLIYARPSRLVIGDVDLGVELEEIRKQLFPKISGKELIVQVPQGFIVKADRAKIAQVLINLLENAVDAAQSMVTISAETAPSGKTLTISDDGPGIRPEDIGRLYEPFFTTKKGGTGLGLPICKKIVEDHGGRLDIRSAPGKGTDVTVILKG